MNRPIGQRAGEQRVEQRGRDAARQAALELAFSDSVAQRKLALVGSHRFEQLPARLGPSLRGQPGVAADVDGAARRGQRFERRLRVALPRARAAGHLGRARGRSEMHERLLDLLLRRPLFEPREARQRIRIVRADALGGGLDDRPAAERHFGRGRANHEPVAALQDRRMP